MVVQLLDNMINIMAPIYWAPSSEKYPESHNQTHVFKLVVTWLLGYSISGYVGTQHQFTLDKQQPYKYMDQKSKLCNVCEYEGCHVRNFLNFGFVLITIK